MNWDQIQGNWKQFAGSIKEHWGKLTDSDLATIQGRQDQMIGRLQERYGIAKEEAESQLRNFLATLHGTAQMKGNESKTQAPEERKRTGSYG